MVTSMPPAKRRKLTSSMSALIRCFRRQLLVEEPESVGMVKFETQFGFMRSTFFRIKSNSEKSSYRQRFSWRSEMRHSRLSTLGR